MFVFAPGQVLQHPLRRTRLSKAKMIFYKRSFISGKLKNAFKGGDFYPKKLH